MKGEAETFAVEAKANAEAEQMARKADAWKQYEDADVVSWRTCQRHSLTLSSLILLNDTPVVPDHKHATQRPKLRGGVNRPPPQIIR